MIESLEQIFEYLEQKYELTILEFDGEKNHVHLLIDYKPSISISKLAQILKGASSRYLKRTNPEIKKYIGKIVSTLSYFVTSIGGAPLEIVKQYIQNLNTPTE